MLSAIAVDILSDDNVVCTSCDYSETKNTLNLTYGKVTVEVNFDLSGTYTCVHMPNGLVPEEIPSLQRLYKLLRIGDMHTIDILKDRGYDLHSFDEALGDNLTWFLPKDVPTSSIFAVQVIYAVFHLGEDMVLSLCA